MKEGDTVTVAGMPGELILTKLPRSEGRRRPRAQVEAQGVQVWVYLDQLKVIPGGSSG